MPQGTPGKIMRKPRKSLWNAAIREKYSDASERLARKTVAEKNGEHTAENLEQVWTGLAEEEKLFLEFLYLSEKRTVIALQEDALFSGLIEKSLLQIPPGVGAILKLYLQTTCSVPIAVWERLHDRPELFFSGKDKESPLRLNELAQRFNDRVDVLLKGPSPRAEV